MAPTCTRCGAELPDAGDGCSVCGAAPADGESTTAPLEAVPHALNRDSVRLFGAPAVGLSLGVGFTAVVLGLGLLAGGSAPIAVVLVAAGLAILALFASEARVVVLHGRTARSAERLVRTGRRTATRCRRFVAVWSKALLQVTRYSYRRRQLERRKSRLIRELGHAAYAGADARADELNREAHAAAESIQQIELRRKQALRQARRRATRRFETAAG